MHIVIYIERLYKFPLDIYIWKKVYICINYAYDIYWWWI